MCVNGFRIKSSKFASGPRNITLTTTMATIGNTEPFIPYIGEFWSQYVKIISGIGATGHKL